MGGDDWRGESMVPPGRVSAALPRAVGVWALASVVGVSTVIVTFGATPGLFIAMRSHLPAGLFALLEIPLVVVQIWLPLIAGLAAVVALVWCLNRNRARRLGIAAALWLALIVPGFAALIGAWNTDDSPGTGLYLIFFGPLAIIAVLCTLIAAIAAGGAWAWLYAKTPAATSN